MGSCAAPSAKGDDKFITTDYLQQCLNLSTNRAWLNPLSTVP
ncbi:putative transposase [Acinetobacter baumannii 480175]|nr:putative transposase [Acinetobacter baumannii 480175]